MVGIVELLWGLLVQEMAVIGHQLHYHHRESVMSCSLKNKSKII